MGSHCATVVLSSASIYRMVGVHTLYTLLVVATIQGVFCLKCEVGVNNETTPMEGEGSWEKVQEMMKEKMGTKWEDMKSNLTGDMTGLIEQLKKQFEDLKSKVENALKPSESRRKRDTELFSHMRVKRGEEADSEPEPEQEDDYYCIKKSLGGTTVKSCLPKSVADPLKMACSVLPSAGKVCVCNDKDLCNKANILTWNKGVLGVLMMAVVWNIIG